MRSPAVTLYYELPNGGISEFFYDPGRRNNSKFLYPNKQRNVRLHAEFRGYVPGISLLALSAVQGYHGYVLFVWLYGICLGGFTYSLKMFTLERVRSRHFTKAWSFVQGAKSFPVLIGIPITGYINQTYPKAGYYFSFVSAVVGASLMFLVGTKKEQQMISNNGCKVNAIGGCVCPYNGLYPAEVVPYGLCRRGSNHYERVFSDCERRQSYRHRTDHAPQYLPKSLSYAANIDQGTYPHRCADLKSNEPKRKKVFCRHHHYQSPGLSRCNSVMHTRDNLRPSKSVPEGLARWECYGSCRRPIVRNVQVIEQITTSV